MSIEYKEDGIYNISVDTNTGTVIIGNENYIENDPKMARLFELAYIMGRDHKKRQIARALSG